ncbi:phosphate ABC transporter substrate-binding protein PstS [Mycobacterium marinum]|uniref:phosphate ABC transporter substrate-binding protein PstS n=1 Tax=Mycobacterium marinum TaxID=1781 RepID=UPI000B95EAD5|nr:phosphate ABC transporter substrate-binding protein PstS [Mycobacterium marinum]MDC8981689.1 phosphate ABC transporter substrate-binding protein PstS [Mycobacterium marinum]MDC8997061.1 phosphate ABC transporter substrate-binding protein PstS [Mycobacterium marinum]MDC8998710.1 phosphate ABC transporter substrate-binding protein PstS [Mycobacterium marinum]MDC9008964.1 phosphate ABC transporter substrate-binding protein PstS [Mycobacterium marinum]MDC9015144.1 phosphate ABC transporter subs
MKSNRSGVVLSLLLASTLALSACGGHSSNTSSSTGSSTPLVPVDCGGKKKLLAAGSTAQKNAMEQFVYAYIHACPGHTLDYNANGSGAGMKLFLGNQTDFAGSDTPMNPAKNEPQKASERCGSEAWDLPVVFGPIAVTYNLKGVSALSLDGPTLAKIFNGAIAKWDDPAIKALNTSINLPPTPIHVVFRSDQSGTTANFQQYLDAASDGAWGKGAGQTFNGGVGEGAAGNDGTSQALKRTDGSITYNEWSYAVGHQLNMAQIITSAGPEPVTITAESVGKTIAGATFKGKGNDLVVDTSSFYRPTQDGAYPIVLVTYEIVCSKYPDAPTGTAVKAFMQATIGDGQVGLDEYGYIPLPESFRSKLIPVVNAIA